MAENYILVSSPVMIKFKVAISIQSNAAKKQDAEIQYFH
jgi:hypothetical protein